MSAVCKRGRHVYVLNTRKLATTRFGIGLALLIAKSQRPRSGHAIVRFLARRLAKNRASPLGRSVRANQWIAGGKSLNRAQLDDAAQNVLVNAGYSLYDFYHFLNKPDEVDRRVHFSPDVLELLDRMRKGRASIVVVAPHVSNFDLVVQAAGHRGIQTQILTLNDGAPAYQMQDLLRSHPNLAVTPVSVHALKMAVQRLQEGGSVVTGVDRPLSNAHHTPRFFGRPAPLPVHHVYLARKVNAPVCVIGVRRDAEGHYHVRSSDPIKLTSYPHPDDEMVRNAERVLEIAAEYIRAAPEQWAMFYPVWPHAVEEMEQAMG